MDRDDEILDYLQDRLSPEARARFEDAMRGDPALAAEVEVMRAVRAELATGPAHENAEAVWDRISEIIDPAPVAANDNRRPWMQVLQYAAVAAVAVIAWQFAIAPRFADAPGGFQAASEETGAFTLQVKFADTATIADISSLLTAVDGTVISGPSALGLLIVSFPDAAAQQAALTRLIDQPDLVELAVEP